MSEFSRSQRPGDGHVAAELRGLHRDVLEDAAHLLGAFERALQDAGAVVEWSASIRTPDGGVIVIAIPDGTCATLRSLPSRRSAAVDIHLAPPADADLALTLLSLALCPLGIERHALPRTGTADLVAS